MGSVKINVDAVVSVDHGIGTAVAICKDRDGSYLGSLILIIRGLLQPTILEVVACREAQALAQDLGLQHLHVSSDCKQVIMHIQQKSGGEEGGIIKK